MFADICRRFIVLATASCFASLAIGQNSGTPDAANAQLQEMQKVEDAWSTAIDKRDQYGLENVLSPQLVDIAATGDVTTRNQDIAKLFTKDALPLSMTQKVITVRTLNDAFALVSGTYTLRWPEPPGSSTPGTIDEKGIFTHVFQAVNGHWLCVNSQRTVVAEQMPQAKTKASAPKAKSNAAEPFHIPLVYKGAQSTQPPAPGSQPPPN
jgi:hypothetical protein